MLVLSCLLCLKSPSSTLCTGVINTLSFTKFSYTAFCACYVSRPIHPHNFGLFNNIREILSSLLHKILQSPISHFHFSAAPNTVRSILCNILSLMYKFGFRSSAASSVKLIRISAQCCRRLHGERQEAWASDAWDTRISFSVTSPTLWFTHPPIQRVCGLLLGQICFHVTLTTFIYSRR
jgi:hypothetical protein